MPVAVAHAQSSRFRSLDGLRGAAALVVVVHHSLLAVPALSDAVADHRAAPPALVWLVNTPIHLLWAGGEAVLVFFVLSGFVLTRAATSGRRFAWRAYYPARLVRIYVPVVGAVVFSLLVALAVPRRSGPGDSGWLAAHAEPLGLRSVLESVTLVDPGIALNSPLWSLRWEVVFSLALPAFVLLATRLRAAVLLPAIAVVMTIGGVVTPFSTPSSLLVAAAVFLPVFLIGAMLCIAWSRRGTDPPRRGASWALLVLAVTLTTFPWSVGSSLYAPRTPLSLLVVVLGATCWVVLALVSPLTRRVLEQPAAQWLGKVSFSLYLVHEPIVVSVALLLPSDLVPLTAVIALPLSLLAAWGFFTLVEGPAHRLSQQVGRRMRSAGSADPVSIAGTGG